MHPTVPPPPRRLLIFARPPQLGQVKSRLAATLGEPRALAVYEAMLGDVLRAAGPSSEETAVEVMWAPATGVSGSLLRRAFGKRELSMQTGATLGDRLSMAFAERFFFQQAQRIIAIGSDDPGLDREMIDHAFALLESCEWVVGPAEDGGYYLIGCRAAAFSVEVFEGIAWGTSSVAGHTLEKIRSRGITVAVLPQRWDIDTEEDLRRYGRSAGEGELARLLRQWGW